MATVVNNTTINSKLTIIFDAGINPNSPNDGPALGSGNTESDVIIDNKSYLNLKSHTEISSEVHALQWNASTNSGHLEYIDNRENESITSLPSWVTNVVIRCEGENAWKSSYDSNVSSQLTTWVSGNTVDNPQTEDNFVPDVSMATTQADADRISYLSNNGITY